MSDPTTTRTAGDGLRVRVRAAPAQRAPLGAVDRAHRRSRAGAVPRVPDPWQGVARSRVESFPELADRIAAELGWVVLTMNFRGCGTAEGNFSLDGWLDDVHAAVEHLRTARRRTGVGRRLRHRWVAARCAKVARNPRVAGVAALATPADFDDWARNPRRLLLHARQVQVIKDPQFPTSFDQWAGALKSVRPIDAAARLAPRPLLVVHGDSDDLTPQADGRALAEAHGNAEFRLINGAGHELRHDPRAVAVFLGLACRGQQIASRSTPRPERSGGRRSVGGVLLGLLGRLHLLLPRPHRPAASRSELTSATERGCSSENGDGHLLPAGGGHAESLGEDGHEDLRLLLAVAGQLAQAAVQLGGVGAVGPELGGVAVVVARRASRRARGCVGPSTPGSGGSPASRRRQRRTPRCPSRRSRSASSRPPSRSRSVIGPLNAHSIGTCWSSSMPMSSASGIVLQEQIGLDVSGDGDQWRTHVKNLATGSTCPMR